MFADPKFAKSVLSKLSQRCRIVQIQCLFPVHFYIFSRSLNTVDTNNSSKTATPSRRSTLDTFKNQSEARKPNQGTKFLLSDREYNSSEKPLNTTIQNNSVMQTPKRSEQIQDFFSSSFLEGVGYSEPQNITSNLQCFSQKSQDLNSSMQSAGAYYTDIVAKNSEAQRKAENLVQIPQKPFFLSQNQLSRPVNNLVNSSNYGFLPNPNKQSSQPVRRNFMRYNQESEELSKQNMSMNILDRENLDHTWSEPTKFHNILSNHIPRSQFEYPEHNIMNETMTNMGHRNLQPNFTERNQLTHNSQRIPKSYVEQDHIYSNLNANSLQPSLTNPMAFRNLPEHPYLDKHLQEVHPRPYINHNLYPRSGFNEMTNYSNYPFEPESIVNKENLSSNQLNIPNSHLRNDNCFQSDTQGFFLNQPPQLPFLEGPKTMPWNTSCVLHGVPNCLYCLNKNYPNQPYQNSDNRTVFGRHKSFTITSPAETTSEVCRQDSYNDYFNQASIPYSQHRQERGHQNNFFLESGGRSIPYGAQKYGLPTHFVPQYQSKFQNGFGRPNLNVPRGLTYQEVPLENNINEENIGERNTNKNFMLSKFLDSFDETNKV